MTSLGRLGCAAVLLAAGLVPTVAPSAQAQTATVVDAAGDVSAETYGPRRSTTAPAPDDTTRDITRVDLDYRKKFVVAVVQLREIRGRGKGAYVQLRLKGGGTDSQFAKMPGGRLRQTDVGAEGIRCRGGTYVVDPGPGTVQFRVPARCIGAPDRVRFGVSTVGLVNAGGDRRKFTVLTDDARTTGKSSYAPPRLGAPVRRA